MAPSDVFANAGFYVWRSLGFWAFGEERPINFGGTKAAGPPHDDVAVLVVPLENGSRANPQLLADFGGNGDLSLCGNLGFGDRVLSMFG